MPKYLLSYKWDSSAEVTHAEIKSGLEANGWNADILANGKSIKIKIGILHSSPNTTLLGDFNSSNDAKSNIFNQIRTSYINKHQSKHLNPTLSASEIHVDGLIADGLICKVLEDYIIVEVGEDNLIKV